MDEIKCLCDSCDIKSICEYYQHAVKPVLEIVRDSTIPQEEPFTIRLVKAVSDFYCDQYE